MFTGIITELGEIASLDRKGEGAQLTVRAPQTTGDAAVGDSISVNGICLTVVEIKGKDISFDVSFETLNSTNLGSLKRGDRVNLEPALKPNSKMGGHFVTGHIDGIGKIRSRRRIGNADRIEIEAPAQVLRYLVGKGSVAIDGISLTVVDVLKDAFSVVIIPHTADMTTIGFKKGGDTVNLEPDILAKYVAKFVLPDSDASLMSSLKKSGFLY
ncbi:MAG TPA: riboflavin synthase [Dissulfurispiraceae bacterium]|nr:riboflavin synthase [Dissulfurispiraceae bacterium]